MADVQKHLDELTDIRTMMERSTQFISLSGLSGVAAGVFALLGAAVACWYLGGVPTDDVILDRLFLGPDGIEWRTFLFLLVDGAVIMALAVGMAFYFTNRKALQNNRKIWDATAQRLLINLAIPLVAGGLLCLILLYHRYIYLLAPFTIIFYGLALINASKYTLDGVRYLGLSEVLLGLIATFYWGHGLIFWMIGFGILHIVYGGIMYYRYER